MCRRCGPSSVPHHRPDIRNRKEVKTRSPCSRKTIIALVAMLGEAEIVATGAKTGTRSRAQVLPQILVVDKRKNALMGSLETNGRPTKMPTAGTGKGKRRRRGSGERM